ncbi:MAG: FAA hydrolase family protein [Alphaproteobacteria bacterium]|nr:MAG: FAA hydrolase family protein [Alphaproteobacteria bacterium]
MPYIFPPTAGIVGIPVLGQSGHFPVRRVFCAGRNYAAHAKEMGWKGDSKEEPFFFTKPNDTLLVAASFDQEVAVPYPLMTKNLHHEIELVVALGSGGSNLSAPAAGKSVFGYALGLDLTRRDLQNLAKEKGQPWDMAKGFDYGAPISPIIPAKEISTIEHCSMELQVNGIVRQHGKISDMIWNIPEIIAHLSQYIELKAGDLIFTGTPEGVNAVQKGDILAAKLDSFLQLKAKIV